MSSETRSLAAAVRALAAQGVVPGVAGALGEGRPRASQTLRQAIRDEVSAYSESGNPDLLPELVAHLEAHFDEIEHLLAGRAARGLEFVREHAERRAGQRFPLEALLHTYRCAHKSLSNWIRDAALATADASAHVRRVVAAAADFAIEYTDAVSTIATSAYVEQTRAIAEAEGDRRTELLNLMLSGYDESDGQAARLLRRSGYLEQRQSYCVVAARSVDPVEMQNAARAQRMADAISEVLGKTPFRSLVGVRDQHVIAIVSATRRLSGWTAPQSLLAERLYPELRKIGPAALIGLSNDVPSTAHVPRAASEAKLALDFANVADRVVPYARIPFRQMLVSHARDSIQAALPGWLDAFLEADRKARGKLSATLRAYADADMNVLQAAKRLSVHPNTIYSRAQRITDMTDMNPLRYHDLTEMLLAIECRGD